MNQTGISDLEKRLEKLRPTSKGLWGHMQVMEMIRHCNAVNHLILSGVQSNRKSLFKQQIAKILFVKLPFRIPKNLKAPKIIQPAKEKATMESFDEEKAMYLQIIRQFPSHRFPLKMYHPAFGNLSPKEWGVAAWRHMDHHLRQFGV